MRRTCGRSRSWRRNAAALGAILVAWVTLGDTQAQAQNDDWERAEDTAVGDQNGGDATQAEVLLAPPNPEDEDASGEGSAGGGVATGGASANTTRTSAEDEEGADADDEDAFGSTDRGGAFHIYGDIGTFIGPADVIVRDIPTPIGTTDFAFSLSPWLGVRYEITDRVSIGAEGGFALLVHGDVVYSGMPTQGGSTVFGFGNPLLYARWLPGGNEGDVVWGADVGVALPLASTDPTLPSSTGAQTLNYQLAIAERGGWDLHLFTESMPVTGGLFLELRPVPELLVRGEADVAILFDVAGRLDGTKLVLQVAADGSYRLADAFGLGARIAAILAGGDVLPSRESFQLSLAPYAKLFFDPGYVAAELVINLTEPYGTSFRQGKYYGIRLLAGVTL
jgi:hypothetical protein